MVTLPVSAAVLGKIRPAVYLARCPVMACRNGVDHPAVPCASCALLVRPRDKRAICGLSMKGPYGVKLAMAWIRDLPAEISAAKQAKRWN